VIVLTFSCSDKEDSKIIAINPGLIELSDDLQESYFQLAEGDYPMYGYRINYGLDGKKEVSYNITREILASEQTVIELSDGNKATFRNCISHLYGVKCFSVSLSCFYVKCILG
jgi:hypothetical protein